MHKGVGIIGQVSVRNTLELGEIVLIGPFDILEVNFDMFVSISSLMLVQETECVHELVQSATTTVATITKTFFEL